MLCFKHLFGQYRKVNNFTCAFLLPPIFFPIKPP